MCKYLYSNEINPVTMAVIMPAPNLTEPFNQLTSASTVAIRPRWLSNFDSILLSCSLRSCSIHYAWYTLAMVSQLAVAVPDAVTEASGRIVTACPAVKAIVADTHPKVEAVAVVP